MSKTILETPYAVYCRTNPLDELGCGQVFLTEEEYTRQMMRPNATWQCPNCGSYDCFWDDENYEKYLSDEND